MYSNFELSVELKELIHLMMVEVGCGDTARAWDAAAVRKLLALQHECLGAFHAAVQHDRHFRQKTNGGSSGRSKEGGENRKAE